jgi:single-stranded-DNA-specific exonuclease
MKIKSMYDDINDVTIESYLEKCGVDNVDEYLKGNSIESTTNYDNIDEWCDLLHKYITSDNPIYLLVDCDMDGWSSASLFYTYVKIVNNNANIIPLFHHKNSKAHGLADNEIMEQLKKEIPSLLAIVDAGSEDEKECKKLKELGYEIITSDHHSSSHYNTECVLVNNQASKNVINKGLSGCGVTWKCLKRYDELYGYNIAKDLISYVALGNASDSMSMVYQENRAFSKWGFTNIHKNLQPLFDYFISEKDIITNINTVWNLTPKGNALIRIGELQDKIDFFYFMCGEYKDTDEIIDRLKKCHSKQKTEREKLFEEVEIVYNGVCILAKIKSKTPLTGLVANILSSKHLKPVLLVHDVDNVDLSYGSVRSVVPIKKALEDSGLFEYNKGHEDFSLGTAYKTSNEQKIIEYLDNLTTVQEPCIGTLASTTIKSIPNHLYSLTDDYKHLWSSKGVPSPTYHIKPFTIYNTDIQALGKGSTIKFNKDGLDFIMFFVSNDMKENVLLMNKPKTKLSIELIVELSVNKYTSPKNGKTYINNQAIIKEIQCSPITNTIDDIL